MIPPPIEHDNFYINKTIINVDMPKIIPEIAELLDIPKQNVIDLFSAMGGAQFKNPPLFCNKKDKTSCCDGVHPVDAGYKVLAETVYKALFERKIDNWE